MKQFPHTNGHHLFKVSILAIALLILMALYLVYSKLDQSISEMEKNLNIQMHSVNSTLMADLEVIQDKQGELFDKIKLLNEQLSPLKTDAESTSTPDQDNSELDDGDEKISMLNRIPLIGKKLSNNKG